MFVQYSQAVATALNGSMNSVAFKDSFSVASDKKYLD